MKINNSMRLLLKEILSFVKPKQEDVSYQSIISRQKAKDKAKANKKIEESENIDDFISDIENRYAKAKARILNSPKKKEEKKKEEKVITKEKVLEEKKIPVNEKAQKTKSTKKISKKAQKTALYRQDILSHYGKVDEDLLTLIVNSLGTSIYKENTQIISFDNPKELLSIRRNFLSKKLALKEKNEILDKAIQEVGEEIAKIKIYRATVYYRLAQKFNKKSILSK